MTSTHTSNGAWDAIVVGGGPAGSLAMRVSSRLDYLWRAFFRAMHGESTYAAEPRRIPGLAVAARAL